MNSVGVQVTKELTGNELRRSPWAWGAIKLRPTGEARGLGPWAWGTIKMRPTGEARGLCPRRATHDVNLDGLPACRRFRRLPFRPATKIGTLSARRQTPRATGAYHRLRTGGPTVPRGADPSTPCSPDVPFLSLSDDGGYL